MTPTKPDNNPTGERLPAAPPVDLDLRVKTLGSPGELVLEYQVHSPTGAAEIYHETIRSEPLRNPDAFKALLFKQLASLHGGFNVGRETLSPEEIERDLESLGHLLYERLFPKPMRDAYRRFRHVGSLRITTDEPWIPWELVKADEDDDDDDFFCLQFRLSRWLAEVPPVPAIRVERLAVIEAGESEEMAVLPKAGSEAAALDSLGKEMGVDVERCPGSPFQRLERLLHEGGRQLYHFVGHGEFNAEQPDESRLLMGELSFRSRHLTGTIARRLRKDRPFVFASACEVGQQGWSLTGLGGWAERWVEGCGCSAFLGPQWRVKDERAGKFADAFYRHLRDGQPLGEAVREARRELKAKHPGKIDWLAYSLYGHPNARIAFGQAPFPEIPSPPPGRVSPVDAARPLLEIPEPRWNPERSPPGALLRPDYGIVPFHFRDKELDDLLGWCRDESAVQVRLYTGAGGMGKTRLALEACRRLRDERWQTGLLDVSRPPAEIWPALQALGGRRLVLVDYAETRREVLVPLLRGLHGAEDGPIRLVLLARAALDWWEQLKNEGEGVGELLTSRATSRRPLPALAFSVEDRTVSYRRAALAFADELRQPTSEAVPDNLDAEHFERALLLHMSALAAIEGVNVKDEDGILDHVLGRETRFWERIAVERELAKELVPGIGRAMAVITLAGGADGESQAVEAMRQLRLFQDQKYGVLLEIARLLHETYPGNRWIDPVQPDLLGEHLIEREMEKGADELLDLVLGPRDSEQGADSASSESPEST